MPVTMPAMRLLAVFAHPDDELGCIGTLKKHAERGDAVMLVWTTHGELASQYLTQSEAEVRRIRQQHGAWVAKQLGASYHFFDMGDSRMTGARDEALALARLYATFRPDAVITWSDDHPHPDHRMTAKIAFDAITLARIPKILNEASDTPYEAHRQTVQFFQYVSTAVSRPRIHVDISGQIDLAEHIFAFYQDFYQWRYTPTQFRAAKAQLGHEVGVDFAESFQRRSSFAPALEYLD